MKEIRWHARAGQGAKTASHLLAVALVETGKYVQAFPEYGPERRGAPIRAFNRIDVRPIRRHDAVTHPDVVVVLDRSLLADGAVVEGLAEDGILLVNANEPLDGTCSVPATSIAPASVNLVMLGALACVLGEPPLETLADAAIDQLGRKADSESIRAAITAGFEVATEEAPWAA
jgi:pyruvate ferredoxin oxidoreductase gamma subunit